MRSKKPGSISNRRAIRALSLAIALVLAVGVVAAVARVTAGGSGNGTVFGVLEADPTWLASDSAAGIRLAIVNLQWSEWEPGPGQFDPRYAAKIAGIAELYRRSGWAVAVDLGLQSPPSWVMQLPAGALVDEFGDRSGTADFEYSAAVRQAAAGYIDMAVGRLGSVRYYRVGLGDNGEALYPDVQNDGWWAFGAAAQGMAPGRPTGVGPSPLPGWVPGQRVYQGRLLSEAAVGGWYDWYFGAMVNALAWEISTYRSAGYDGQLQLVMPGTGTTPEAYSSRLSHYLAPDPQLDSFDTVNTAAVWWKLLDVLPDSKGIVVDVSSVDDESGTPRGNGCQPSDAKVDYHRDPAAVEEWSDTRWLSYLARLHGLNVMGENTGETEATDLPAIFSLVRSCRLTALQWAFDFELHDEQGRYTSIDQLADAIRQDR